MKRALKMTYSGVLASKRPQRSSETAPPALSFAAAGLEGHLGPGREAAFILGQ
jgi:hypothetical protein